MVLGAPMLEALNGYIGTYSSHLCTGVPDPLGNHVEKCCHTEAPKPRFYREHRGL